MRRSIIALLCAASLLAAIGLAACTSSGASASASASAASASASTSVASASLGAAAQSASASSAAQPASSAAASAESGAGSSASDKAPAANANGKHLATGKVVTTTIKDRAADLGITASDFANDDSLLTLLVLESPINVTSYKGGSDYSGEVTAIRLPNDEMFRQFSGKTITIGVDKWGEWPADLMGALYNIVLDFDADGLVLVEY